MQKFVMFCWDMNGEDQHVVTFEEQSKEEIISQLTTLSEDPSVDVEVDGFDFHGLTIYPSQVEENEDNSHFQIYTLEEFFLRHKNNPFLV